MQQVFRYYGQYQGFRGRFGGLPSWARAILFVLALPGLALLALSIVAGIVSILALLLLTVPAYRLLSAVTSGRPVASPDEQQPETFVPEPPAPLSSPGRRHVDVKIIDP
jgi:hypothetical protein